MLRSANPTKTADMQAFRGTSCRGEDSNLCCVAKHDLTVGAPHRNGSGLASLYSFVLTLVVAPHLPYGLIAWAAAWSVLVYRATSRPRNSGAKLTTGEAQSE